MLLQKIPLFRQGSYPVFCRIMLSLREFQKRQTGISYLMMYKKFESGGKIEIIDGYRKKADHRDLVSIARFFAKQGGNVKITTDIHFKDARYREVFGGLIGTKYERKCPDLIIDGKFYEYENYKPPFKKEKISNMLSQGIKQSSRIIINNNKGTTHRIIRRNIYNRVVFEKQNIDEVWLYEKGEIIQLYKKTKGNN